MIKISRNASVHLSVKTSMDEKLTKWKMFVSMSSEQKLALVKKKCIVTNIVCRERVLEREFDDHDSPQFNPY